MNYAEAIDDIWTVISNEEMDDWFSERFDEELEKCDVFMENGDVNEIPLKTLREYVDDYNSYFIMREVIESIKKFKEDFEKQVRAKEAYKKVNKRQSDKIKELKKENEELKKRDPHMFIATTPTVIQKYREEIEELKKEIKELKKEKIDKEDDEEEEEEEEEEICSECKRKKECKSDMFVTIRELDGTESSMCGMCSLTHFENKRDGLK